MAYRWDSGWGAAGAASERKDDTDRTVSPDGPVTTPRRGGDGAVVILQRVDLRVGDHILQRYVVHPLVDSAVQ